MDDLHLAQNRLIALFLAFSKVRHAPKEQIIVKIDNLRADIARIEQLITTQGAI